MQRDGSVTTIAQVLNSSAALYPDRPALSDLDGPTLTYAELFEAACCLSHWLTEQGIVFGDKIAILSENSLNWGVSYLAITSMGAVAVPILTEFHPEAIAHILRHSEAKLVFVSEKLFSKFEEIDFDQCPQVVDIETCTFLELGTPKAKLRELKKAGMREFRRWKDKAVGLVKSIPQEPGEKDLAAIIYTSGTTGFSKGVMLTHKNILTSALSTSLLLHIKPQDRLLSILPLAHAFECTLGFITPLLHGAHIFYLDKPPTARALLPALATVQPTIMLAVPLVMEKIYKNTIMPKLTSRWLLRKLYSIVFFRKLLNRLAGKKLYELFGGKLWIMAIGGAPLASDAERFLHEARFPYTIGYGLTECSPLLTATPPETVRLQSAGGAVAGITLRIADVNPLTGEGEIQAFGDNIMKGYFKSPEATAESFTEDGWYRTGDLGYLDSEGYVYIKGRSKNMILGPNGENIYPEEVESLLFASPFVAEALVQELGGRLVARVYLDEAQVDGQLEGLSEHKAQEKRTELLESIRKQVNARVSSFSRIHKIIEQPEPFEKTPTHKIKRYLYCNEQN